MAIILNCAGPDFISIYYHFQWSSEGDKERPDKLLEKLEEYCAPKGNVVVTAYRFWNARWKEPFDAYLTELRTMAALCEYDDVDRMIRDKIVFSASGKLQELLLRDTNLTLGIAIDICRAFKMTHRQVKEMNPDSMIEKVNVRKTKREYRKKKKGTRAMQLMKTRQQRNATTVATHIGQVETIVQHGANSAHFVKRQITSVRNARRNVRQYVLSTIRMPTVTPNGCICTASPETR